MLPASPIVRRRFALAALALTLGGCAASSNLAHLPAAEVALYADRTVSSTPLPVASAAATLPQAAGRIVQVTEQRFADGLSQAIVLMGDRATRGENRIDVAFRLQPDGELGSENKIKLSRPTETGIARELEAHFPDVAMETVPVLVQNGYGPYGVAAGRRANGERCIYAWQYIEDAGNVTGAVRIPAAAVFYGPTPVSVRVRLCRMNVSADALAGLMNDLVIGGVQRQRGGAALPSPAGPEALIPAAGAGGAFNGYVLPNSAAAAPLPANEGFVPRARPARRAKAAHRRRVRNAAYAQPPAYVAAQPAYVAAPPAYAPPSASPLYAPPVYAPAPQARQTLDQTLPPQAYRGPGDSAAAGRPPAGVPVYNTPERAPAVAPLRSGGRLQRDPAPAAAGANI